MRRMLRTFVVLPLLALLLVAVPALLLSFTSGSPALAKGVPPGGGTVPTPTRIWHPPHRPPHRPPSRPGTIVYPTATPVVYPTATPQPQSGESGGLEVGGYALRKVIGDRLSPVIYAFTVEDRLYRSTNNGRSWSLVSTRPAVRDFIMSPADPYMLYSGLELDCEADSAFVQSVFVSADGGASFTAWDPPVSLKPLLAHPTDPNRALAASCDGIYMTGNGGQHWELLSDSSETALWRDYVPVEIAAAYTANSAGQPVGQGLTWEHLYVVAEAPGGASVVAYSNDEGDSWGQISPSGATAPFRITSLAVAPQTAGRVWVAEIQGVWSTQDNGLFWALSNAGLSSVLDRGYAGRELGLNDVVLHPDETLYLGTGVGLYEKPVAGAAWIKTDATEAPFRLSSVQSILFTDSRPDVLWLNTDTGVFLHQLDLE